jgi:hypothetical protein
MIRKSVQRFSEKIMPNQNLKRDDDSTQSDRALVTRLCRSAPLRVTAAAAAMMADEMTGLVHRAVQIEPADVSEQHQEGDPERELGLSIHAGTPRVFVRKMLCYKPLQFART